MMTTTLTTSVAVWRRRVAAVLSLAGVAAPAAAQRDAGAGDSITWTYHTAFERSAAAVDTTSYLELVETCLAAVARAVRSAEAHTLVSTGLWRDTLGPTAPRYRPQNPNERYRKNFDYDMVIRGRRDPGGPALLEPLPDTVVATARQCTRLIPTATALRHLRQEGLRGAAPLADLLKAYLIANRDADVAAIVRERLQALPADDAAQRRAVVDTVLGVYVAVQPVRREASEALLEQHLRAAATASGRLRVLDQLRALAEWVGDTAAARARATQIMAEWEQVPAGEREQKTAELVGRARRLAHRTVLLDSLRRSTAAYLRAQRVLVHGDSVPAVTGDTAPVLTADFWFRRGDTARPRPGKVELLVFFANCDRPTTVERASNGRHCARLFPVLRRLEKRFPEIGITLVVPATKNITQRAYPDPAAEAEALRQWLHDEERLPGALAVQVLTGRRRPAPDRRWIWEEKKEFHYGEVLSVTTALFAHERITGSVLVDRDGLIIRVDKHPNAGRSSRGFVYTTSVRETDVVREGDIVENEAAYIELIAAALQQPH